LLSLKNIHELGIMHRDVKPENLLLRDPDDIFDINLIDFGLAAFVDDAQQLFSRCGTPGFVAPEIISLKQGEKYD